MLLLLAVDVDVAAISSTKDLLKLTTREGCLFHPSLSKN